MIEIRTLTWTALVCLLALPLLSYGSDASSNAVFGDIRKITTKDGIEQQELIKIGGIPQWISIRSRDQDAPILLVLHGGPGFTLSPVSHYYMRDWEEFFTVVQWDQRGAGKTYRSEDTEALAPTMQGRHDRGTSSVLVAEWHAAVKAPHKKLIWFDDSSHMVYEEEPGKLLVALVNEVLPLTR